MKPDLVVEQYTSAEHLRVAARGKLGVLADRHRRDRDVSNPRAAKPTESAPAGRAIRCPGEGGPVRGGCNE